MEFEKLLNLFINGGGFKFAGKIGCRDKYQSESLDMICKLPFGYVIFDEIRLHDESIYFELFRDSSKIGALNRLEIKSATIELSLANKYQKYLLINNNEV